MIGEGGREEDEVGERGVDKGEMGGERTGEGEGWKGRGKGGPAIEEETTKLDKRETGTRSVGLRESLSLGLRLEASYY